MTTTSMPASVTLDTGRLRRLPVASDGAVETAGDAPNEGSAAGTTLNQPIVGAVVKDNF